MNNLKKLACLVALSPVAFAAEVAVGSSLAVIECDTAKLDTGSKSLTGLMSSVSYHESTSSKAGLYGSANVFLSPSMIEEGGPRFANIGFGGTFKTSENAELKIGVIAQVEKSASAEYGAIFTSGFQFGNSFDLGEGYNVEFTSTVTFPLESAQGDATRSVSLGFSKSIDVVDFA